MRAGSTRMLMLVAGCTVVLAAGLAWGEEASVKSLPPSVVKTVPQSGDTAGAQREFAAAAFGLVVALATSVNQMCYSFGPGLLGLARDGAGSYAIPLACCALFNALAAAALLLLRPRAPCR